ncbi:thymocyte nuclear protein 1 [Arthroderma uncinatum]|uniref:thymocyte nuclear protein 1 n=1 Tax=Arthroderma uncinatum TaxID=74035 RepID=UPI00144AED7E|nr:thymocyte nuclear protein 1 [Arthroderma uncinatum]KAF3480885.1 thymocyte nuclear protein 1 [Arthroderma uncinatum]
MAGSMEEKDQNLAESENPRKRRGSTLRAVKETAASSRPKRVATSLKAVIANDVVAEAKRRPKSAKVESDSLKARQAEKASAKDTAKAAAEPVPVKKGRPGKKPNAAATVDGTAAVDGATKDARSKDASGASETKNGRSYWLMKAEPETRLEKGVDVRFSIDDLRAATEPEGWDGVRNAAARNHMRAMKKGDIAFFYHSNCKVPGIAGTMQIVRESSVDESAFDPAHPYYDPKSNRDSPKWDWVHVQFRSKFKNLVTLADIKSHAKPGGALENLQMVKQSRLSVSPVTEEQWKFLMSLAEEEEPVKE